MSAEQLLIATSIFSASNYLLESRKPPIFQRSLTKTLSVGSLAVISFLIHGQQKVIAGLAFSSLGDAFLSWDDTEQSFLLGLGSFLIAHVFYVGAFAEKSGGPTMDLDSASEILITQPWRGYGAAAAFVLALGMSIVLIPRVKQNLQLPVVGYITVIAAMLLMAMTVEDYRVVSGAVMFAASDVLLAFEKFVVGEKSRHKVWTPYAVWGLYYLGQLSLMQGMTGFRPGFIQDP